MGLIKKGAIALGIATATFLGMGCEITVTPTSQKENVATVVDEKAMFTNRTSLEKELKSTFPNLCGDGWYCSSKFWDKDIDKLMEDPELQKKIFSDKTISEYNYMKNLVKDFYFHIDDLANLADLARTPLGRETATSINKHYRYPYYGELSHLDSVIDIAEDPNLRKILFEPSTIQLYKKFQEQGYLEEIYVFSLDDYAKVVQSKNGVTVFKSLITLGVECDIGDSNEIVEIAEDRRLFNTLLDKKFHKFFQSLKNLTEDRRIISWSLDDVFTLYNMKGSLELIEKLNAAFGYEVELFEDIIRISTVLKDNSTLDKLFSKEIKEFKKLQSHHGFNHKNLTTLLKMKDNKGNKIFCMNDIKGFLRNDIDLKYVISLGRKGLDANNINYLHFFNLSANDVDFKGTEKPNALIVYPTHDNKGAFRKEAEKSFFNKIRSNYDTKVIIASREEEVYKALDSVPSIDLLVLGGHGSRKSLNLGCGLVSRCGGERGIIDTSDKEIEKYLLKLNSNAVIFLNSCSNANGGKDADNLANFIVGASKERKVIAATESFKSEEMHVKSIYPFDIKIIDNKTGKDLTYTNK